MFTEHFTLERTHSPETLDSQNHTSNGGERTIGKIDFSHPHNGVTPNGSNGKTERLVTLSNPYAACNFIVTWNGEDARELLQAIHIARESQDRFIQDKLIEYILNIPLRNPRPTDIPAFVGRPVWAVDKNGRALIGMPGAEQIVPLEELRDQLKRSV